MAVSPSAGAGPDSRALSAAQDWVPAEGVGGARLRPRTLIALRWLGVGGQAAAVLFVGLVMRFPLPWALLVLCIGISAALNLTLTLSKRSQRAAGTSEATFQLAFDVLQLTAMLYLTGGLANPFSLMLIAPVTLAAATLPARNALALGLLGVAATVFLAFLYLPLPWAGPPPTFPSTYRLGLAVATIAGVAFTAGYAFQAASEAHRMELALNVTETVLAREQRLSALGALAAAAAHELGTPLATIAVVAKEMAREAPEGPMKEDAELLVAQAQRCRDILKRLAETPDTGDAIHERMSLLQFLREVVEPYADGHKEVKVEAVVTGAPGVPAPDLWRRPEVLHAMTSIVENAFDFARAEILVTARFDAETVTAEVRDDGPGFSPEVLAKLGEPYVTSRPGAEGSRTGHIGMGLGFFIAKTLLERTGAVVSFENGRRGGAIVAAKWPRARIEAPVGA